MSRRRCSLFCNFACWLGVPVMHLIDGSVALNESFPMGRWSPSSEHVCHTAVRGVGYTYGIHPYIHYSWPRLYGSGQPYPCGMGHS
jgi:hypothetical protein